MKKPCAVFILILIPALIFVGKAQSQSPEIDRVCEEAIQKIRSGDFTTVRGLEVYVERVRICYGSGQRRPDEFEQMCREAATKMRSGSITTARGAEAYNRLLSICR